MELQLNYGFLAVKIQNTNSNDIKICKVLQVGNSPWEGFSDDIVGNYAIDDTILVDEINMSEVTINGKVFHIIKEKHICGKLV
jgi:co-chaperonin GroES (HSP10)